MSRVERTVVPDFTRHVTQAVLSHDFPPAGVIDDWSGWLYYEREEGNVHERIRRQTHTGRPCGSSEFLDQLEHLMRRTLHPKKGGRPRKRKKPV